MSVPKWKVLNHPEQSTTNKTLEILERYFSRVDEKQRQLKVPRLNNRYQN